jgi:hypothetical protein
MIVASAALFVMILVGVALRANSRLQDQERLPMQWWFTGEATWFAPRLLALALIPALAIATLATYVLMARSVPPRVGQEDMVFPAFLGLGTMFVAVQLFHLWLVHKTLSRNGS